MVVHVHVHRLYRTCSRYSCTHTRRQCANHACMHTPLLIDPCVPIDKLVIRASSQGYAVHVLITDRVNETGPVRCTVLGRTQEQHHTCMYSICMAHTTGPCTVHPMTLITLKIYLVTGCRFVFSVRVH
jgi:hypothetical protein